MLSKDNDQALHYVPSVSTALPLYIPHIATLTFSLLIFSRLFPPSASSNRFSFAFSHLLAFQSYDVFILLSYFANHSAYYFYVELWIDCDFN